MKTKLLALCSLIASTVGVESHKHVVDLDHYSSVSDVRGGIPSTFSDLQVNLAMSLLVSGNFSNGLPVLKETSGCSFASLDVRCELATRATLLVLTALVRISSFSIALTGSSLATAAADSVGAAEPATDGALEVEGMLGLAMLGALPVPWTGGIVIMVCLVIAYGVEDRNRGKRVPKSNTIDT